MEFSDLFLMRITFANIDTMRSCMDVLSANRLFAYAAAMRAGTYCLQLTTNEDATAGYKVDENTFGITSADAKDDVLLEIYTNARLMGKIEDIIEQKYEESIRSYVVLPIYKASRNIRVGLRNLNQLYKMD
ncbi:MAG: hypothetical protein II664_00525 [Oscillospiraceae bacterium]|nr:hypothetical protein [Oscillospiraceae bacterium]